MQKNNTQLAAQNKLIYKSCNSEEVENLFGVLVHLLLENYVPLINSAIPFSCIASSRPFLQ